MEMTFITIHNLSPDANILYASKSITDILGYAPEDVVGRSCFEYFHPDEVPFARSVQSRGIQLDKAAVLHYARIRGADGEWIGCECVFTITYQIMVACTSIYRGDVKNDRRAAEAPAVRRLFASSPRDPRYHMLEHLSSKFRTPPQASFLEPRAALILNRFSHSLTVLYATDAVAEILGVTPEELDGKSFYDCMQENCYPDAERCLRSAKENDSIAYLRFWYHDPRNEGVDEDIRDASVSSDSEDGGVRLNGDVDVDMVGDVGIKREDDDSGQDLYNISSQDTTDYSGSRGSSDRGSRRENNERSILDVPGPSRSYALPAAAPRRRSRERPEPREIEAVVSCTSDGLVVVLRRARPRIPFPALAPVPPPEDGVFAAPWGAPAIRPHLFQPDPQQLFQHGFQAPIAPPGGPPPDELLASIQEVAVFAWSLIGINGNIASYSHGVPRGDAQPADIPVWNPYAVPVPSYPGPENQAALRWAREKSREPQHDMFQYRSRENGFGHGGASIDHPMGMGVYQAGPPAYMQQNNFHPNGLNGYQQEENAPYGLENNHKSPIREVPPPEMNPVNVNNDNQEPERSSAPGKLSAANRYLWY